MHSFSATLLTNVSATGAGAGQQWNGGRGALTVVGTFGGTAATLEYLGPNGTSWIAAVTPAGTAVSLSAQGMALFEVPPGTLRVVLTGGVPVAIYANADRIPG